MRAASVLWPRISSRRPAAHPSPPASASSPRAWARAIAAASRCAKAGSARAVDAGLGVDGVARPPGLDTGPVELVGERLDLGFERLASVDEPEPVERGHERDEEVEPGGGCESRCRGERLELGDRAGMAPVVEEDPAAQTRPQRGPIGALLPAGGALDQLERLRPGAAPAKRERPGSQVGAGELGARRGGLALEPRESLLDLGEANES